MKRVKRDITHASCRRWKFFFKNFETSARGMISACECGGPNTVRIEKIHVSAMKIISRECVHEETGRGCVTPKCAQGGVTFDGLSASWRKYLLWK